VLKFNSSFLIIFHNEATLFENTTLDHAFLCALAFKYKFDKKTQLTPFCNSNPNPNPHTRSNSYNDKPHSKPYTSPLPKIVSLRKSTTINPSLLLMTNANATSSSTLVSTHNCQIKDQLANMILNNGSQNNLMSQTFVILFQHPTTPHPSPYQLGLFP
jgi:hypothetical protein